MEICTLHRVAEALPGDRVYLRCLHCLHTYRTSRALRRAHRREVLWYLLRIDHATGRHTFWRTMWKMVRTRADVILVCPHCCAGL